MSGGLEQPERQLPPSCRDWKRRRNDSLSARKTWMKAGNSRSSGPTSLRFKDHEKLRVAPYRRGKTRGAGHWLKFDRPASTRLAGAKVAQGDFADGYDPYRTTVGMPQSALVLTALGFAVFLVAVSVILIATALAVH